MTVFVALLRAVNVGGYAKVAMSDLRDLLGALDYGEVRSLLQSGNLVFRDDKETTAELERVLEAETAKRLDLRTDFLVRAGGEMEEVVAGNPFHERLEEQGVTFDMIVSHGNAVGMYFRDPEENRLEIYWATGLQARQPYLETVDLSEPPDEIMRKIRGSVAEHGATGFVDRSALARQNIPANT